MQRCIHVHHNARQSPQNDGTAPFIIRPLFLQPSPVFSFPKITHGECRGWQKLGQGLPENPDESATDTRDAKHTRIEGFMFFWG